MPLLNFMLNQPEYLNIVKTKVMKISFEAKKDLIALRKEMKKKNPSPEKISNLLCGTKYNIPICTKKFMT